MFLQNISFDVWIWLIVVLLIIFIFVMVWKMIVAPKVRKAIIRFKERMSKVKYKNNYKLIDSEQKHFEIIESNKTFFDEWYTWISSKQGNGLIIGESEGRYKNFFRMMYFLNSKNRNKPSMYIDDPFFDLNAVSLTNTTLYEITNEGLIYDYQTKKEYKINFMQYYQIIAKEKYGKKYLQVIFDQLFARDYLKEAGFSIESDLEKVFNNIVEYLLTIDFDNFSFDSILKIWELIPKLNETINSGGSIDKTLKTLLININKILSVRQDDDLEIYFDKLIRRYSNLDNPNNLPNFNFNKLFKKPFIIFKKDVDYDFDMNLINTLFIKTINFIKEYQYNENNNRDLLVFINDFDGYQNFARIDKFLDHPTEKGVYYYLGINTISNFDIKYPKYSKHIESLFDKKYLTTPTSNFRDIYLMDFTRRWIHKEDFVKEESWMDERVVTERKIKHYNQMSYNFKNNAYVNRRDWTVDKFKNYDVFKHNERIKWHEHFRNKHK